MMITKQRSIPTEISNVMGEMQKLAVIFDLGKSGYYATMPGHSRNHRNAAVSPACRTFRHGIYDLYIVLEDDSLLRGTVNENEMAGDKLFPEEAK